MNDRALNQDTSPELTGWNNGHTGIGDVVEGLGVRIGEVVLHTGYAFIFLDEDGSLEWLWSEDPPHMGWASARIVELEAKCAFFRANRPQGLFTKKIARILSEQQPIKDAVVAEPEPAPTHGTFKGLVDSEIDKLNKKEVAAQEEFEERTKHPDSMRHELSARRFIAQGLVILCCKGTQTDDEIKKEAEVAFIAANNFILQRGREISLIWIYQMLGRLALISALMTITVFALAMWDIFPTWSSWGWPAWHKLSLEIRNPIACIGVGGLGAFVSRALAGRDDLPCDANAGRQLHNWEALMRWMVGSSAAGLLFLLVRSEVVKIGDLEKEGFALCLALAFLAGMSERFLPSVLNRFNEQVTANPGLKPRP
jgi:hypothetical protein